MGDKSQIEWTNATWNVFTGCNKVSPGSSQTVTLNDTQKDFRKWELRNIAMDLT